MCDNYCDCHRRCPKCNKLKAPSYQLPGVYPSYPRYPYTTWGQINPYTQNQYYAASTPGGVSASAQ